MLRSTGSPGMSPGVAGSPPAWHDARSGPAGRSPGSQKPRPRRGVRGSRAIAGSDGADSLGLRPLLALGNVELDPLVLFQAAVAAHLDRGEVHENVSTAAVYRDEAEALLGVEPLHGSLRHVSLLLE